MQGTLKSIFGDIYKNMVTCFVEIYNDAGVM